MLYNHLFRLPIFIMTNYPSDFPRLYIEPNKTRLTFIGKGGYLDLYPDEKIAGVTLKNLAQKEVQEYSSGDYIVQERNIGGTIVLRQIFKVEIKV